MKILFIRHKGCNLFFLDKVLKHISSRNIKVKTVDLKRFSRDEFTCTEDWVIIYQTFPGETSSERRFQHQMIERADIKFLNLKNKNKILFDSHDDGHTNAFSRFDLKNPNYNIKKPESLKRISELGQNFFLEIPRIKNTPNEKYLNKFNVILQTSFGVEIKPQIDFKKERLYKFHYWANPSHNKLREEVQKKIKDIVSLYPINTDKLTDYPNVLEDIFCEINVPGHGEICFRHLDCLSRGSLILSQEAIKDFYIIPYVKLVPYEDYIPYNLENIGEQIRFILNNKDEVDKIRKSGHKKLVEFYSTKKCTDIFEKYLSNLK